RPARRPLRALLRALRRAPGGSVSDLKIDVLMGRSLVDLERQCRDRMATGVDGLFTFEGQHDPFLPLAIAASTVEADLMTNVAIAFPRSPMQLANVAYDLQV